MLDDGRIAPRRHQRSRVAQVLHHRAGVTLRFVGNLVDADAGLVPAVAAQLHPEHVLPAIHVWRPNVHLRAHRAH